MRKLLALLILVCFFVEDVEAQKRTASKGRRKGHSSRKGGGGRKSSSNGSFLIGVPVNGLSTWLVNAYHKARPVGEQDYNFSLGYQAGLLLGYEFTSVFSVHVSGLYSLHQQKYSGRLKGYNGFSYYDYTSSNALTMIDIPLFLQFEGAGGGYFEAGPMYSLVQKATYKLKDNAGNWTGDVAKYYPSSRVSVAVGFGMDASLDDGKWFLKVGFRGNYTFTDMLEVNALGFPYHPVLTSEVTKAFSGGIHLGLVYKAGY